jgi:two-component system nitrogen regulation sensor histidine kinase GlnL
MPRESPYESLLAAQTTGLLKLIRRREAGDGAGRLLLDYANPAAADLLGSGLHPGEPLDELLPGAGALHRALADALREGQGLTVRELVIETAAGRPVTVDATLTLLGEAGDALLVELVALDRHRLIAHEQQLATQQETLREVVRGLAHEIKNPLGGLRGAAQLLERSVTDATARECARVILTEADRLRALVDALLGPAQRAAREPTNLHELIEHVLALVAHDAPGITLARDYDPSLPEVVAVRDHLTQALLNLARNAVEAIASAAPPDDARQRARGTLKLRTRALRQYTLNGVRHRLVARVDVEDDGPGVPPELRERLFFPMVSGRDGGSGLGLAIAQDLVTRHGGLIEWTSQPGHTVFSMLLPLLDDK